MGFISALALIMLTMVGYSGGAVAAGKGRLRTPGWFDLLLVALLWVGLFAWRAQLGRWETVLAAVIVSALVGALITLLLRRSLPIQVESPVNLPPGSNVLRATWLRWKHFNRKLGNFQGRLLMSFVYFLVVTPFGLGMRLLGDPLGRNNEHASGWHTFHNTSQTLDESRRQY